MILLQCSFLFFAASSSPFPSFPGLDVCVWAGVGGWGQGRGRGQGGVGGGGAGACLLLKRQRAVNASSRQAERVAKHRRQGDRHRIVYTLHVFTTQAPSCIPSDTLNTAFQPSFQPS